VKTKRKTIAACHLFVIPSEAEKSLTFLGSNQESRKRETKSKGAQPKKFGQSAISHRSCCTDRSVDRQLSILRPTLAGVLGQLAPFARTDCDGKQRQGGDGQGGIDFRNGSPAGGDWIADRA
jgi:hypothetical protein